MIPTLWEARFVLQNGSLLIPRASGPQSEKNLYSDAGDYQCEIIVNDRWIYFSRKARLRYAVLSRFEDQPTNRRVFLGDTVVIPCRIKGSPPPQFHWYKDAQLIDDGVSGIAINPVTGTLEIEQVQMKDQGVYKCKAENSDRARFSKEGHLTVEPKEEANELMEPKFENKPRGIVANVGTSAVLECAANGYPMPTIQWLKEDSPFLFDEKRMTRFGQASIIINRVRLEDAGVYTCQASNSEDTVECRSTLEVQVPPSIVVPPKNVTSTEANDVYLECNSSGIPQPSISWYKNGELLKPSEYFVVSVFLCKVLVFATRNRFL
ncbi:unnamed protein product [Soboliphyme baturini]|uniref:Ig-like domain-containing protein n=1 Tax=Soboliphyme baturini TaxID=241478 RepID=A0A183INQ4_9BILA|nr:unnamed protein product [Soboliphyme baturini]